MVKKERRRPPTSEESVANALDRCDEDGGAAATLWPLPYETSDLLDVERRVLNISARRLSASGMVCPQTFSADSSSALRRGASRDTAQLKSRIARFLHDHKDASDSR